VIKILVAEDDELVRDYVIRALKGHVVVTAWNGAAAVEYFRKYGADLVLLDHDMPVMNGDEACREIRKLSADVPIFSISGRDDIREEVFKEVGFNGQLRKPFELGKLRALAEE